VPSTISPLINAMFDTISGKGLAFSSADVEAISYSLFSPGMDYHFGFYIYLQGNFYLTF
jgi:hypothetical protein